MKTDFKKFIISFSIICALFITVDYGIGFFGDKAISLLPNFSGQTAKNNYRLNRISTDVIIIGSSRASHHYVTNLLKDSINSYTHYNYSVYNAGIDGKFINSNLCTTESLLKRYTPKLLILEISNWELEATHEKIISDMMFLAPHYTSNNTVRDYIDRLGWKENVKVHSNLYRYNGQILGILKSFFVSCDSTGYEPIFNEMTNIPTENVEKDKEQEPEWNHYCVENFYRVLDYCQKNQIHLVIVTSPMFRSNDDNNRFIKKECLSRGIPYFDLMNIKEFNDNQHLFQDISHLNDKGAHIYTNLFFNHLKPYLQHMIKNNN